MVWHVVVVVRNYVANVNGGIEGTSRERQDVSNLRAELVEKEGTAAPGLTSQPWFAYGCSEVGLRTPAL